MKEEDYWKCHRIAAKFEAKSHVQSSNKTIPKARD